MRKLLFSLAVLSAVALAAPIPRMLIAARAHVGDRYSADYFSGGRPPRGRSACVDVVVSTCRAARIDLQAEIQRDSELYSYPLIRDRDIDHRWAPNLKVWMDRHALRRDPGRDYQPGDLVFWSLTDDGVADHCGVVGDERGASGKYKVIHQYPPACTEEDCLGRWKVMGHYRLR